MSDTLLESQLFGHERGAFTGAQRATRGKFELADHGTLFLDEIADMSPLAQAKILRAIEYGQFERLGSEAVLHSNARIISASNRSLREEIRLGKFREDLYGRLNGVILLIPALRDRAEDLPALIAAEFQAAAVEAGKRVDGIRTEAMQKLLEHPWPGNLRELHHTVRRIVLFCDGPNVLPEHVVLHEDLAPPNSTNGERKSDCTHPAVALPNCLSLDDAIREYVHRAYVANGRRQRQTAKVLGISRARLSRHLRARVEST